MVEKYWLTEKCWKWAVDKWIRKRIKRVDRSNWAKRNVGISGRDGWVWAWR